MTLFDHNVNQLLLLKNKLRLAVFTEEFAYFFDNLAACEHLSLSSCCWATLILPVLVIESQNSDENPSLFVEHHSEGSFTFTC